VRIPPVFGVVAAFATVDPETKAVPRSKALADATTTARRRA
jgi:hypothetical protein